MSIAELATEFLSALTIGGIIWYVVEINNDMNRESRLNDVISETAETPVSQKDIESIGSGTKAEQALANSIFNARDRLLIAGPINRTVYTLLRDYNPSMTVPEIITNPNLSSGMYMHNLTSRYGIRIRYSDSIISSDIILFFIDNNKTMLLQTEDNTILLSTNPEAAIKLAQRSIQLWETGRRNI